MFQRTLGLIFIGIGTSLAVRGLPEKPASAQEEKAGRKLALLVGVKKYDHDALKDLDFPENDVEGLGAVLKSQGFDTVVLTTARGNREPKGKPTADNIRRRLKALLEGATKNDLAIVALAGHGIQPLGSDDSYFCPADANPVVRNDKPIAPERLISIGEILGQLADSGIGDKLLMVDACRNNPSARSARRRGVDHVNVAALPGRTGVLLSCSQGEFSFEEKSLGGGHGVFFHYVIEGLKGEAKNREDAVTWDDLGSYVRGKVPRTVKSLFGKDGGEQSPNAIGNLRGEPTVLARIATPPPRTRPGQITNSIGMKLRLIPDGEFQMGGDQSPEEIARITHTRAEWHQNEQPQHKVRITKPFYLGAFELTQREFQAVMSRNPSSFSPHGAGKEKVAGQNVSRFPVETVSWFDAIEFCNKLSEKENLTPYYRLTNAERNDDNSIKKADVAIEGGTAYRLPTEAEWEYACRAGTSTPFHFGSAANGEQANVHGDDPYGTTTQGPHLERPTTVGSYKPNGFGLYDMHGNVWEWCWDSYDNGFYAKSPEEDPTGPSAGAERVGRGGSWYMGVRWTRSACRYKTTPADRPSDNGFRVARTP